MAPRLCKSKLASYKAMEGLRCNLDFIVSQMATDCKGLAALRATCVGLRNACDGSEAYWRACTDAYAYQHIGYRYWVRNAPGGFTHRQWLHMMIEAAPELSVVVLHHNGQTRHVNLCCKPVCSVIDTWKSIVFFEELQLMGGRVVREVTVDIRTGEVTTNKMLIPGIRFGRFYYWIVYA